MESKNEKTIGQVIKEIIKKQHLHNKLTEIKVKEIWEKVMGKAVAARTQNIFISNHCLYVSINSAALKQELLYSKQKLIDNLNEELGENSINDVVIH